jgi:hypothetical protein
MKHIKLYEEQHKTPFKINGESVIETVNKQWASHKESKEEERRKKVRIWVIEVFLCSNVVDRSYLSFQICIPKQMSELNYK